MTASCKWKRPLFSYLHTSFVWGCWRSCMDISIMAYTQPGGRQTIAYFPPNLITDRLYSKFWAIYTHVHVNCRFPAQSGLVSSPWFFPPICSNCCGITGTDFLQSLRFPVTQPTVSKHWRKPEALTSSILFTQPDSWQKKHCFVPFIIDWLSYGFTSYPSQNRSFRRRSSQPISWLTTEKTKSNTTKAKMHPWQNIQQHTINSINPPRTGLMVDSYLLPSSTSRDKKLEQK